MQTPKRNDAEVVIRELRLEDYDALVALWREAGLPYRPKGRDAREAIARQLKGGIGVYLVAEVAGAIVGAVLGTHDGRKGWINRLAVLPAYRRRRVGAQLLAEAERRLAALDIEIFACLVEDWNGESKGFFEKAGYKPFREVSYYTKRKNGDV
ncbi:MAG: GNAT family N-acetyltransferase [candidate division Zixibacteria bacterium]|nr:GNAT family N-acetyltransferase [candidate division Zixibacteria bacterium]